ncbi:hypothetical protein B0H13DRAFT_1549857, partial [Mycena leptocephala]
PERRHRKLLNDGSEEIERVFMLGLLPYQNYMDGVYYDGRGKRNASLVDFLQHRGIVRTRAQVFSRVQVLCNMGR